jgi:hypothetical protein
VGEINTQSAPDDTLVMAVAKKRRSIATSVNINALRTNCETADAAFSDAGCGDRFRAALASVAHWTFYGSMIATPNGSKSATLRVTTFKP